MKSFKKLITTVTMLLLIANVMIGQDLAGATEEVVTAQPSWIENPIGSIIGLILLIAMFAGMAKVALAKE